MKGSGYTTKSLLLRVTFKVIPLTADHIYLHNYTSHNYVCMTYLLYCWNIKLAHHFKMNVKLLCINLKFKKNVKLPCCTIDINLNGA